VLLQDFALTNVAHFEEYEILLIIFDRDLPLLEDVLTMDFTGMLNDQMRGFYRRYAPLITVHDLVVHGFQPLRTLDLLTGDSVS
jgi:puromycin-sensitive aminopeptidase